MVCLQCSRWKAMLLYYSFSIKSGCSHSCYISGWLETNIVDTVVSISRRATSCRRCRRIECMNEVDWDIGSLHWSIPIISWTTGRDTQSPGTDGPRWRYICSIAARLHSHLTRTQPAAAACQVCTRQRTCAVWRLQEITLSRRPALQTAADDWRRIVRRSADRQYSSVTLWCIAQNLNPLNSLKFIETR